MKPLILAALMVVGSGVASQRMETSIGGNHVSDYHASLFDPHTKLYLYSGGD